MSDLVDLESPGPVPSLNIDLWENETDFYSIGRESIPFINRPSMMGRESLLITDHRSSPFDRFRLSEIELHGRESLGILNLNDLSGVISPCGERVSISSGSYLDKGFLLHPEHVDRRLSALSSLSSIHSLETSSKINIDSNLNRAFFDSSIKMRTQPIIEEIPKVTRRRISSVPVDIVKNIFDLQCDAAENCKEEEITRQRINSVPVNIVNNILDLQCDGVENGKEEEITTRRISSVPVDIVNDTLDQQYDVAESCKEEEVSLEEDPTFNDSVFIEANSVASNIANGSIFEESFEGNTLDDTAPPDLDNLEKSEERPVKICDEQSAFKKLDELIPPTMDESIPQDNSVNKPTNNNSTTSATVDYLHKDATELLQNLTEIISVECKNKEHKRRSQSLLSDLTDILIVQREMSQSENGNTPLRTSKSTSDLDLSTKSYSELSRLNQSYTSTSTTNTPPVVCNLKKQSDAMKALALGTEQIWTSTNPLDSKVSVSSIQSDPEFKMPLKDCKLEDNIIRRGPLKMISPINVRNKVLEDKIGKPAKTPLKRRIKTCTSTPIYESKGKFAQSTPENNKGKFAQSTPAPSSLLKKFPCGLSPLKYPTPVVNKSNSSSLQNLSKIRPPPLDRRNTVSNLKSKSSHIPLSHTNSLDKIDKKPSVIPLKHMNNVSKVDKKPTAIPLKRTSTINSNKICTSALDRQPPATDLKPKNCRIPLKRTYNNDKNDMNPCVIPPKRANNTVKTDKKPTTIPLKLTNSINSNKKPTVAGKVVLRRNN